MRPILLTLEREVESFERWIDDYWDLHREARRASTSGEGFQARRLRMAARRIRMGLIINTDRLRRRILRCRWGTIGITGEEVEMLLALWVRLEALDDVVGLA